MFTVFKKYVDLDAKNMNFKFSRHKTLMMASFLCYHLNRIVHT